MTTSLATPPALAAAINEGFPELNGRVLAVSDSMIGSKDNIPTLPLCQVALMRATANGQNNNDKRPAVNEALAIEFWYEPSRYKRADGKETPFWSFYDYDSVMTKLFAVTTKWITPRGQRLLFVSMDIEATQFAVILTFRFDHAFVWCYEDEITVDDCGKPVFDPYADGQTFIVDATLCAPPSLYCPEPEPEVVDPCAMVALDPT